MALFEWTSLFSIKEQKLDIEHMEIINQVNRIHDVILRSSENETINKQLISELFEKLKIHFKNEEELFEKKNYQHKEEQQTQHQSYIEQIQQFTNTKDQITKKDLEDFLEIMTSFIINHLMKADQEFSELL